MRTPEPRSGQLPDKVLKLDTTPPKVRVFPVHASLNQPGTVLITWDAVDPHLDLDSVRVEYSLDARQWHLITTGKQLETRGRLTWKVPKELPPKVFLRVSASDTAGNTGVAQTSEQTSIDLVAPEGKVTGIRPDTTDDRGPMPREVGAAVPAGATIPIEELLKALIPAVLNSPAPDKIPVGSERPEADQPCEMNAREWLGQLTRHDVVLESPRFEYSRPDPFSIPELGSELTPNPDRWQCLWDSDCGVTDTLVDAPRYDRPLVWTKQIESNLLRRLAQESAIYSGRSLLNLMCDTDWKPSTAAPESIEPWDVERFRLPFNGAYDSPFPRTDFGRGVALDF
jgi:hypothetical protein